MLINVHRSHTRLIVCVCGGGGGGGRVPMSSSSQHPKRPSATARTINVKGGGYFASAAKQLRSPQLAHFNTCVEQDHIVNVRKSSCWGTTRQKDNPLRLSWANSNHLFSPHSIFSTLPHPQPLLPRPSKHPLPLPTTPPSPHPSGFPPIAIAPALVSATKATEKANYSLCA